MAKKKSSNPLTSKAPSKKKAAKAEEAAPEVTPGSEGGDTFGGEGAPAGDAGGEDSFEPPADPSEDPVSTETFEKSQAIRPTKGVTGALAGLKLFTVEGEYAIADGKNWKVGRYKEHFVLKAELTDSQARSLCKRLLIAGRLKDTKEGFRRVRTYQITQSAPATKADLDKYGLKQTVVAKMSMGDLSLFCAQNQLGVIPTNYSSIEEARLRVEEAHKSGKKVNVIPKDSPKKAPPMPGQVDRNNKPLTPADGLIE